MNALRVALACVLLCVLAATPALAGDPAATQAAIAAAGGSWTAGHTSMSDFTPEQMAQFLSWEAVQPPEEMCYAYEIPLPKDAPAHLDWRNIDGRNFLTPIKDQHPCGTCATFSSLAAFEALIKIAVDNDFVEPDLSEEHVYACEGPLPYTFFHPMIYLKGSGAPDETCFPYDCQGADDRPPCSETCADWGNRAFKTTDYGFMMWPSPEKMIAALQDGPIIAGFQVYEDFQDYESGVYEHVTGKILGGHGVALIGYDADEQYWIIKNSWGDEWGEDGYAMLRWQDGFLRFGYQSVDVKADFATLCSADTAPVLADLILPEGDALTEIDNLTINFGYADLEANLRGGELFYAIDDEAFTRYEAPMRELVGTSNLDREDAFALTLPGPFFGGEHTLTIYATDLCGAESNEVAATFTVAGGPPADDDDATPGDDDDTTADDDDDSVPMGDDDDDDDDGGCG
jgi:Papain family cysteine protease